MKKDLFILGMMVVATLSLTNCTKEIESPSSVEPSEAINEGIPFELFANPVETKTVIDGFDVTWEGGVDQVNVYHAVAGSTTYVSDGAFSIAASDVATGRFTGSLAEETTAGNDYDWYVFYPYISAKDSPASNSKGYAAIGCTAASGVETQNGNNNTEHLAGSSYPLYGKATGIAYNESPSLNMQHLAAFVEFNITNNSPDGLTISSIKFDAPQNIIGTYYINFADPANIKYTSSGNSYVASSVTLNVSGGSEIAVGNSAKFYIGIKPMAIEASNESPKKISITINGDYTKEINLKSNTNFLAGKVKKINVDYDYDPTSHAKATYIFNTTAGLSALGISAPSAGSGTNLSGNDYTVNDINLAFAKGNASNDIRVWNKSGTYDLRSYTGNKMTFTAPTGFNVTKIVLSGSSVNGWSASPGTISSGTWTGESSSVVLTASANGNINTIAVECTKAAVVPTIADAVVSDAAVQGGVGLTKAIVLSNFEAAPTLSATPDGTVVTAASVSDITASGATVTYTLAPNYSGAAAVGTITISDNDSHSGTITINQLADTFTITRDDLSLGAPSGSSTTITVKSDYDWTVVDDDINGFTVSPMSFTYSGTQSQTVTITATGANSTAAAVDLGMFTIKRSGDNKESSVITVSQLSAKLATPTVLLSGDASSKKITASWTKDDNATKYEYYVLDEDANIIVDETETSDNTILSFEFAVDYNVEYFVYVRSIGNNNPWITSDYGNASETVAQGALSEEIDLTAQGYTNQADVTTVSGSVVTLEFAKADGSNAPKYYTSGTSVRTYAKNTLTVSVPSGKKITKIEFTLGSTTSATVTASTGSLGSISSGSRTWTVGSTDTNSVIFTNGASGQMHYQKVKVTYE